MTVPAISFSVPGAPAPQGSLRAVARGVLKCDNPGTQPFRSAVAWEALRARAAAGIHEILAAPHQPVAVVARFCFQRPASAPRSRAYPSVKPDLDKLSRAILDALTGILWVDDGQVVSLTAAKAYSTPPRTELTVQIVQE